MLISLHGVLDSLPIWGTFLATVIIAFLSIESGFQYGKRWRRQPDSDQEVLVRTMVSAMVGLMSFTLVFTFWIAASHFDGARQALLNETNAMRSVYMRADSLSEPNRTEIRNLLREYVDLQLQERELGEVEQAILQSEELQRRLWSQAIAAREKTSNPIFDVQFLQRLDEAIDLHRRRLAVYKEFRIPELVWGALYAITALAMVSIGCYAGLTCVNRPPVVPAFILIYAVIMVLIVDLDHPLIGALRVSTRALVDLRNMMGAPNG